MNGLIELKKLQETLDEFEKDAFERHIKAVLEVHDKDERDRLNTIAAVEYRTAREIRNRLGIPEIKA